MPEEYLTTVLARAAQLERSTFAVRSELVHTARTLERTRESFGVELTRVQHELKLLEREVAQTIRSVESTVHKFRRVVKRAELARLQQRVDVWAPEKKVSRVAFQRLLQDDV